MKNVIAWIDELVCVFCADVAMYSAGQKSNHMNATLLP